MAASLALFFCFAIALALALSGATDWLVIENGLIQPRIDQSFELTLPANLMAYLKQENRRAEIIDKYNDLMSRKNSIHERLAHLKKVVDIDTFIQSETECTSESVDLYPAIVDSIRRDEETRKWIAKFQEMKVTEEPPDCKKFSSLPFSMSTFEHLEGMRHRRQLVMERDMKLEAWVLPVGATDAFGSQLSEQLRANASSWLDYTLASVYWKVKGNAPRAIDCSRRAVQYAPRIYKDVALLSLGNIFHRSGHRHDALLVFQAAVDHTPSYGINHFALGNAYAALGDYNSSLSAYDEAVNLGSMLDVYKNRHGVLCNLKVNERVHYVHNLVRRIQANLSDFMAIETLWWKQQATFLNSMRRHAGHFADVGNLPLGAICSEMERVLKLPLCELKREGDRSSLIHFYLGQAESPPPLPSPPPPPASMSEQVAWVRALARQLREIDSILTHAEHLRATGSARGEPDVGREFFTLRIDKKNEVEGHTPSTSARSPTEGASERSDCSREPDLGQAHVVKQTQSEFPEFEGGTVLYPATYKVNRHREDFDRADEWPPRELCDEWAPRFPPHLDTVYPVFLPFENKGLLLESLLSERIGLPLQEEHPLPWHPPVCREVDGGTATASASTASTALPRLPKGAAAAAEGGGGATREWLRRQLLRYVGGGGGGGGELASRMHDAEIGQRILTAYEKKVAPKWILDTLSSLYWRVRNNNANALTCLASANKMAPARYRDVVHTSLASVLLEVGYVEEALGVATQAFRLSLHEPATNFLLSLIHMVKNNRMAHVFHMRQAVRVEPDYMDGLARTLLYAWSCKLTRAAAVEQEVEQGVCWDGGRAASAAADGYSCARAPEHDFRHHGYKLEDEISTIMRLLELKPAAAEDAATQRTPAPALAGSRQQQLQQRYQLLDKMLWNCGEEDCTNLYPVKAQEVQGHSCFFQHLRLLYWMPYLRLEGLLTERGIRLSKELKLEPKLETRTRYKFPECRAPRARGDPALEWLSRVPAAGWRRVGDLVDEISALLGQHGAALEDTTALLAHHVEHHGSWLGFLVAGMWCGGLARGACCVRCFAAALHAAPPRHRDLPLLSLVVVLHLQDKVLEAKHAAYLALPLAPKSKLHLFAVAISHTYAGEYEAAIRMFRASLTQEPGYAVARACLQATMCLVLFMDELADNR